MRVQIVLWNSIAKRRRSISDTFYDNGLATLKGYLEDNGYRVEIVDWARDDFFQSLSPVFLTRLLREIYSLLISLKWKSLKKLLGMITIQFQEILSVIQDMRLKKCIRNLAYEIKERGIHILGVKVWYGEAFANAKYLVKIIKKVAPEVITIAGGYHTTLYEEHLLENSDFDLGVVCEGEFVLEKLLELEGNYQNRWKKKNVLKEVVDLAENGEIKNLIYRKDGKIFKTPRREVKIHSSKSIPKYTIDDNKVRIHVMVESLGCDWGRCNFCVHAHFYPYYSLRDPEEITKEIEEMLKIGIGIFRFAGSDTPPGFGTKIARKILEKKLKIIFGMGSRPIRGAKDLFTQLVNSYAILIESGLRAVFMGGETGNDIINQEVMNKGVVFEDIKYTIHALREAEKKVKEKVYLSLALIYPPPLLEKVRLNHVWADNFRLLKEVSPDSVMITPPGPFLHTKWYEERDRFGFKLDSDIIQKAMEYDYVLYKPPQFWPKLGIQLDGQSFEEVLSECSQFREIVEKQLSIPTDISDEHFLMFYSAGIRTKEDILRSKKETMLDIISCEYRYTRMLSSKVNEYSRNLSGV